MIEEIEFYFHRIVDQKGSFTFEKAIAAVLERCGLALNDQTKYESPRTEKARKTFEQCEKLLAETKFSISSY
jgi:hypothetical protein